MKESQSITVSKRKIIIIMSIVLSLLLGVIGVWFYLNNYSKQYNRPDFDTTYTVGSVQVDENYGYSEMQVTENYKVGACGTPNANSDGVDLYFSNPDGNDVLLKCLLLDKSGNTIGESGVIEPNRYIKTVKFNAAQPAGEHELTIKVLGFEPETYYSKGVVNLKTTINIE